MVFFSRGTICYRVQDEQGKEYALKDCWVDEKTIENEVNFLEMVKDIPGVVHLEKRWDVKFNGHRDSTSIIRDRVCNSLPDALIFHNKVHRRMLLTPCGRPLTSFRDVPEFLSVFRDFVVSEFLLCLSKFFVTISICSSRGNGHPEESSTR